MNNESPAHNNIIDIYLFPSWIWEAEVKVAINNSLNNQVHFIHRCSSWSTARNRSDVLLFRMSLFAVDYSNVNVTVSICIIFLKSLLTLVFFRPPLSLLETRDGDWL